MSLVNDIINREHELIAQGIPEPEVHRMLLSEFNTPGTSVSDWPPELTGGLDIVDRLYPNLQFDSGYPPEKPEPYLSEPQPLSNENAATPRDDQHNYNYTATGSRENSEPNMGDIEGWSGDNRVSPDYEGILMQEGIADQDTSLDIDSARTDYLHPDGILPHEQTGENDDTGEIQIKLDLDVGSTKRQFSFTEPRSAWADVIQEAQFRAFTHSSTFVGNVLYDDESKHMQIILNGKTYDFCGVASRTYDSFEGASSKGAFFNRNIKGQFNCNSFAIRESISNIRDQFEWLSNDYLERVKKIDSSGRFYLIRASAESITDHRGEGEPHRRKLAGDELHAMARTAINHSMDINHLGVEFKTDSLVLDSEYDKNRKEIQMLVHEADPEVIRAIDRGDITAVSINGGAPRSTSVECETDECFVVPRGVVLGELDGIALTWVVTNEGGLTWRGKHLPKAEPGVKITAIQPL